MWQGKDGGKLTRNLKNDKIRRDNVNTPQMSKSWTKNSDCCAGKNPGFGKLFKMVYVTLVGIQGVIVNGRVIVVLFV